MFSETGDSFGTLKLSGVSLEVITQAYPFSFESPRIVLRP